MVTHTNSTARLLGVTASTLALATGATALPSGPAHAADTITAADQPYFAYYHLDQARAKGYTGQGVTIAILDGEVDTSAPELAGADITDKTPCTVTSSASTRQHGTDIASVLVARDYGIAPQAKLLAYRITLTSAGDTSGSDCRGQLSVSKDDISSLLNTAMNDGAMIISLSLAGASNSDSLKWAMARALSQGVIITAGAGNDAKEQTFESFGHWSGVVSVSAIGTDGNRQDYSSWGEGVVSAAVGGPITVRNLQTQQNEQAFGTSSLVLSHSPARSGPKPPRISFCSSSSTREPTRTTRGISTRATAVSHPARWSTRTPASTRTRTLSQTRAWVQNPRPRRSSSTPTALSPPLRSPTTTPTRIAAWTRTWSATTATPTPLTWGPVRATTASNPTSGL